MGIASLYRYNATDNALDPFNLNNQRVIFITLPEPPPPPPPSTTAISPDFTQANVDMWKHRAANGPFRVANDYAQNTPGDWTRIVADRNSLVTSGFAEFRPTTTPTHHDVLNCDFGRHSGEMRKLASAALVHLVNGDVTARNAAANGLYQQLTNGLLDFQNRTRWPRVNSTWHDTMHGPGQFMEAVSLTYQLLQMAGDFPLSSSQSTQMLTVMYHYADWVTEIFDLKLSALYPSRSARFNETGAPYVDSPDTAPVWIDSAGVTGPLHYYSEHRWWNNRRASGNGGVHRAAWTVKFYNLGSNPGTYTTQQHIDYAQLFVREQVKWNIHPDGTLSDFERDGSSTGPGVDLRLGYTSSTCGDSASIATRAALHGDSSLWTFQTTVGTRGSQGAPPGFPGGKSILFYQRALCNYVADGWAKYRFNHRNNEAYRLDYRNPRNGSYWDGTMHSIMALVYNDYHKDDIVKRVLSRTYPNTYWPSKPASAGRHLIWQASGGREPGLLFMYAEVV